jgi:acetolactate synthase I/II/III large subunit
MKYSGAEIIIKLLEIHGIRRMAGIPGGANLPIYDALARTPRIHHVLARHEQGAGFIAQGQVRSTGKVGVFFATSGPGATNALTAIADAKLDSVPIICIAGQVSLALIGTDAFQEVDTYGLSVPITKHNYFVRSAQELLKVIPEAFHIALSGRPGPVLIDVPKDVQNQKIEVTVWPEPIAPAQTDRLDLAALSRIAEIINDSERPIVYVGGGAIHAGAYQEVLELIERTGAPTTTSLMGLGVIPTDHPRFIGMLGMHAARYTNMLLDECDTLIALGVRFDDRATGRVEAFCPKAKVIHIDIDQSEIGKIKNPSVSLRWDLKEALDALLPLVEAKLPIQWQARAQQLKTDYPLEMPNPDSALSPYGVLLKTAAAIQGEYFITTDVGQHQMRVAQCFSFNKTRQLLTSGGLGTMGFGLPAAIGVALEHPDATVICFTGDGSLLMNIQELVLIAEENLNIKVIVCNNQSLGLVYQQQQLFFEKRSFASLYRQNIDFVAIAKGFGVEAWDLGVDENPEALLRRLIQRPGGVLINAPINVEEHVFPMVPPGGANTEMLHNQLITDN